MALIDLLLSLAAHTPVVGPDALGAVNRLAINHFATCTPARPRPFSLWSADPNTNPATPEYITDYTSWPGLTNKQFSARHLPPAHQAYVAGLPKDQVYDPSGTVPPGPVTSLFVRKGAMATSRSSVLFAFFAQWFTDSVLRINPLDRRQNTSNHDIDLCQVYSLTEEGARILRRNDGSGKLLSQMINGEEFLPNLCQDVGGVVTVLPRFAPLRAVLSMTADDFIDDVVLGPKFIGRKSKLYATGLERGNSTIGYVAVTTIFMREHNRIAGVLKTQNPAWSEERLFQTARNINLVILLKLVVEDYINHILGHDIFKLDHTFAENETWYRPNWIALEFDLLYRWHGLAPDQLTVAGNPVPSSDFRYNNALLEQVGVGPLIEAASRQRAGKIGLANTPRYLWQAESWSIQMSRDFRVRPYNEYRTRFGLQPIENFENLTSNPVLQGDLKKLYGTMDNVEFIVGLFAEEAAEGGLFGDLLNHMVAYDAFTQIFSNPLLSKNVYGSATFTDYGVDLISKTTSIEDLVNRNVTTPVRASLGILSDG